MVNYAYIPGNLWIGFCAGDDGSIWSRWKQVSLGRGKGSKRVIGDKWHKIQGSHGRKGYCTITRKINGMTQTFYKHRLILEAFVGPCPEGMECRHLDDNKENNALYNLCWGTSLENSQDLERNTGHRRGVENPQSLLTPQAVCDILSSGDTNISLARRFGVCTETIRKVRLRKIWKHVEPQHCTADQDPDFDRKRQ